LFFGTQIKAQVQTWTQVQPLQKHPKEPKLEIGSMFELEFYLKFFLWVFGAVELFSMLKITKID
jgi:hypothetical protein